MFQKHNRLGLAPFLLMSLVPVLLGVPSSADAHPSTAEATEAALDAAVAEAADTSVEDEDETAAAASTQQDTGSSTGISAALSKLSIHGFLTQAWADASFADVPVGVLPTPPFPPGTIGPLGPSPTFLELSLGIPEDGTTDYRFLALQFRYDISPKDVFVVQFSSRTLGSSPIEDFEEEVELDWAFYERRLTDHTSLKVGRVQIPYGIYNEFRDVGTVLPFYRPSFLFYKEGSFTSETVDGLSLAHTFFPATDWALEVTGYAGEWESIQIDQTNPALSGIAQAKDGYGYEIWLNTPIPDLRIGTGLYSLKQEGGPLLVPDRRNVFHFSLDASLGRFTLQAEWTGEDVDLIGPLGPFNVKPAEWYILAGLRVTQKFRLWAQFEQSDFTQDAAFLVSAAETTFREDFAVAANYFFTPTLVLKAEHHFVDEGSFNYFFDFSSGLFRVESWTASGGSYTIVALSVSF